MQTAEPTMQTAERRPITEETRFTLTPQGQAALEATARRGLCPACGSRLAVVNCYRGGVGYVPYDFCRAADCDFARRR